MKLKRFLSRGFGCLSDGFRMDFEPNGVTLVLGNNEQGKSTLVHAILAALFGEPVKPAEAKRFRSQHCPEYESGLPPSVSLEVVCDDGSDYTVQRTFDGKTTGIKIFRTHSREDCTPQFQQGRKVYAVGEHWTGLSRANFERTALLRQSTLQEFQEHADLIAAIEQVIDTGETGVTAQRALAALEKAAAKQPNPLGDSLITLKTIISRLDEEIFRLEKEEITLNADYALYRENLEQLAALETAFTETQALLQTAETECRAAQWQSLNARKTKWQAVETQLTVLKEQVEGLPDSSRFPSHLEGEVRRLQAEIKILREQQQPLADELMGLQARLVAPQACLDRWPDWQTAMPHAEQHFNALRCLEIFQRTRSEYTALNAQEQRARQTVTVPGSQWERFDGILAALRPIASVGRLPALLTAVENMQRARQALAGYREQIEARQLLARNAWGKKLRFAQAGVALGIVIALTGVFLKLTLLIPIGGLLGLLGMVGWGISHQQRRGLMSADAPYEADTVYQSLSSTLRLQEADWDSACQQSIADCPFLTTDSAVSQLQWLAEQVRGTFQSAFATWQQQQRLAEEYRSQLADLQVYLPASLREHEEDAILMPDAAETIQWLENIQAFLEAAGQVQQIQSAVDLKQAEVDQKTILLANAEKTLSELLTAAGADPECTTQEQLLGWFASGLQQAAEWKRLTGEISQLQATLPDAEEQRQLEAQWNALSDAAHQAASRGVAEAQAHLEEYRRRQKTLSDQLNRTRLTCIEAQNRYVKAFPQIQERLTEMRAHRQRYGTYQDALDLATQTLRQVSEADYRSWSERLNDRVNRILDRFQSPYQDLRFTPNLAFSFVDAQGRHYQQGERFQSLSCGARDQIYLAIRMAITDYLSQEVGHLPLILDDPFINFDDERFRHAMTSLIEAGAEGRQIIVFSCHSQRHFQFYRALSPSLSHSLFLHPLFPAESDPLSDDRVADNRLQIPESLYPVV